MMAGSRKRFWTRTETIETDAGGWTVALDGRPIRTPSGAALATTARPVAEAAAEEWEAQRDAVEPSTMPVTRALNTAIDRIAPHMDAVRAEVAGYGGSDLLCYRAAAPQALVDRQAAAWDPPLEWARATHGVRLVCAEGVIHVAQPPESVAHLRAMVGAYAPLGLAALHELTSLSGSLVLALAVAERRMTSVEAWAASRVDELYQIEQWGEDAEAEAAAEVKRRAFADAARLLDLLRKS